MTSLSSKVPEIEDLRFQPIPSKPLIVTKAVRVGNTVTFMDARGNLYSTGVANRVHYSIGTTDLRLENALIGASKLGCVSQEALKQHKEYNERVAEKRKRQYAADAVASNAKDIGLVFSKSQLKKIAEARL